MYILSALVIIIISFFVSYKINFKIKNYDNPGKDKIQKIKVLTSGGLMPLISFSIFLFYLIYFSNLEYGNYFNRIPQIWMAPTSVLIFVLISFYDDLKYIPFQVRLFVQLSIVYLCISLFPINQIYNIQTPIFDGSIPIKLDMIITIIFWTFIINSTNFIDGYDGMFSFQMITNFLGLSIIFYILKEEFYLLISIFMLFLGIVFLFFNIGRKFKMFIGDVGSIPAGFILGWMLITLTNMGYIFCAIILNLFFVFDVLYTLVVRILNKKSIFIRHNDFIFKKCIIKYGAKRYFIFSIPIQMMLMIISIFIIGL